jgi:hypothetical protein
MKQIQLTQGQVAIVDDLWFDKLNQYKWCAMWSPEIKSFYAARNSKTFFGKRVTILMHAVVAKTPKGFYTDHINHNTLDNRTNNLRVCTNSQNQMNQRKRADNTSGYRGVVKHGCKWQAKIKLNGKWSHLGTYQEPEDAARAYDAAAKRLHGEYAVLNFRD